MPTFRQIVEQLKQERGEGRYAHAIYDAILPSEMNNRQRAELQEFGQMYGLRSGSDSYLPKRNREEMASVVEQSRLGLFLYDPRTKISYQLGSIEELQSALQKANLDRQNAKIENLEDITKDDFYLIRH